jgi:hypothetical protein
MRITRYRIQGFKNIVDITVEGLSDINVFFGLNDVGKSNIFEALALWQRLFELQESSLDVKDFERSNGANLFSLDGSGVFTVELDYVVNHRSISYEKLFDGNETVISTKAKAQRSESASHHLAIPIQVNLVGSEVKVEHRLVSDEGTLVGLFVDDPAQIAPCVHIIPAERRFQTEARNRDALTGAIHHGNLKKALFYAYLSADLQLKKRFAAIKSVLAEPPFSLGELDVALDQETDQIDIGFIRPQGRLPLDNLGSGSRQLLLVLGQVFLNDFPIVALEEPEMNLSPQWQQDLMVALRRLMQDPAIGLKQIFISTHSPYFEFSENFYDVTLDESGHTQVNRTTVQDWSAHFAVAPLGPETGARVNSLNQVRLYDRLIEDLDLRRGDMVVFVRNDAGRWELRKAEEIAQELRPITANSGKS